MKKFILLPFLLISIHLSAQYSTPGNYGSYSLDDLVELSGGVVSTNAIGYAINADLIISESDTLRILESGKLSIENGALWTIQGTLIIDALPYFEIFSSDNSYFGMRFENSNESVMSRVLMEDCGGIKLIESNMEFRYCYFESFSKDYSTGAIDLFHSNPLIRDCSIEYCEGPAIASGANSASSPQIINNVINSNVTANGNTPQINLGTSDGLSPIVIDSNHIYGMYDNAGGIALSTLANGNINAFVRYNEVSFNRYGIAIIGDDISGEISYNFIEGNNIQNDPMLGGSGLNFYGGHTNSLTVHHNTIVDNLWGVTIQLNAQPNLGDGTDNSPGHNQIFNNGNSGEVYALYNNTPGDIWAINNFWGTATLDETEEVIFHIADDLSLGEVFFDPIWTPVGMEEPGQDNISLYPNPAIDFFIWNGADEDITILDLSGKIVWKGRVRQGEKIGIDWGTGIYFVQSRHQFHKLIVK